MIFDTDFKVAVFFEIRYMWKTMQEP